MYSNCQSSVSSSQVFTETLYKYSNINFQIAAFLSIFVFYHKPYFVFVYILKIDSQYVFTIYSTYNVFEFVSTSNTNCLLGFPSNSVQGSMLTSFTSQRLKHLEEQSKFSFLTVTVLQADQKVALPEAELGRNENWKKHCEMSHFFMISRMIPKYWTKIVLRKKKSLWQHFPPIQFASLSIYCFYNGLLLKAWKD